MRWGQKINQVCICPFISHSSYSFLSLLGGSVCQQSSAAYLFQLHPSAQFILDKFPFLSSSKRKNHVEVLVLIVMVFTLFTKHLEGNGCISNFAGEALFQASSFLIFIFSWLLSFAPATFTISIEINSLLPVINANHIWHSQSNNKVLNRDLFLNNKGKC